MFLLLAACTSPESMHSNGSSTIIADGDRAALVNVNVDEGTLSRVVDGRVESVAVGQEPTRVAQGGGAYYVTLRAERGLAKVDADSFQVVATTTVGSEPVGVVATRDGAKVYVASSTSNRVDELDGDNLTVLRSFAVEDHPTWLALHPSGNTLWVASQRNGRLSYIDLEDGAVVQMPLPDLDRGDNTPLTTRLTGDMGISPAGDGIVVPGFFVDNDAEAPEPAPSTLYYASAAEQLSRLNPGVLQVGLGADGRPSEDVMQAGFVGGNAYANGGSEEFVRSYLASARYNPAGDEIWATMEASENVVVLARDFLWVEPAFAGTYVPEEGGLWHTIGAYVHTGTGPRGVAFLDGEPKVHTFLDRRVASVDTSAVADAVSEVYLSELGYLSAPAAKSAVTDSIAVESYDANSDLELGRQLFYSATDRRMVTTGGGVSCSTCHFEGRTDGLSWPLDNGPRQTPNLAAISTGTAPYTWTEGVDSIGEEANATTTVRMGGQGLTDSEAASLEAWLTSTRPMDLPDVDDAAVTRGAAIFAREDVGCATCHSGSLLTDAKPHDVYGERGVDTPTLVGIGGTAPYLHDGSAATLREVLEGALAGDMGDTSMLSEDELSDLEAYLKSL